MAEPESLAALLIEAAGTRTTAEVAQLLGCSERMVRFYYAGKVPKATTMERLYVGLPKSLVRRLSMAHTSATVKARQERAAKRARETKP